MPIPALTPIDQRGREVRVCPAYYDKSPEELAREIAVRAESLQKTQPKMTLVWLLKRLREACSRSLLASNQPEQPEP